MSNFFDDDAVVIANKKSDDPDPKVGGFFEDDAVVVPPPQPERSGLDALKMLGSKALSDLGSGVQRLTQPLVEMDKVTGAPLRAGFGAMQQTGDLSAAGNAVAEQFKAGLPGIGDGNISPGELLPTTPTGEEIANQGLVNRGIDPAFASQTAVVPGLMLEAGLDATNLIPVGPLAKGAKATAEGIGALARGTGKAAGALERGAAKGIAYMGTAMTQGNINPEKALKAYQELNTLEMLFPGGDNYGAKARAGQAVGEARIALQQNRVEVPGSHDVALQVADMISQAKGRAVSAPNSDALLSKIESLAFQTRDVPVPASQQMVAGPSGEMITADVPASVQTVREPRQLTLDELDDLTGMMDELIYTGQGNEKALRRVWGPTTKKARGMLDQIMQTVPEGELFKAEKGRFEALSTASQTRGKLAELVLGGGGNITALATLNPTALAGRAFLPRTYMQMLGALKVPRHIADGLVAAHKSQKLTVMRQALADLAARNPEMAERVVRATTLVSGKPEAQQMLTPEEAGSLDDIRIFDLDQISEERMRIDSDPTMSNIEKAKQLNDINKNGYIRMKRPEAPKPERSAQESPILPKTLEEIKGAMQRATH